MEVAGEEQAGLAGTCPFTVDRPVMRQRWERLTFLHWSFDPADVQRRLTSKTRAILAVHYGGQPPNVDAISFPFQCGP